MKTTGPESWNPDEELYLEWDDGELSPVIRIICTHCSNDFLVWGHSEEWLPNYCPYCGEETGDFRSLDEQRPSD
ncbi:MAG: hypothetical protein ACXABY_13975 [Candidatus Thorarchaeota archaeon]